MPEPTAAISGEQWMRQTERRIGLLERRPAQVGDRFTNDGTMWTRTVPEPVRYIEPGMANSWAPYGSQFHPPGFFKTSQGIVCTTGLMTGGAVNTTAFTLPPGYRPDGKQLFPAISSDAVGLVRVSTDGSVQMAAMAVGGWGSLSGICFPAAGVATWTPVTAFVNGYASYHTVDATYPQLAYWQDPLGRLWWQGMPYRSAGGVPGADTVMFTIPALYAPAVTTYFPTNAGAAHSTILIRPGGGATEVLISAGSSTSPATMAKAMYLPETMWPAANQQRLSMTITTFQNYPGPYPAASVTPMTDGLAVLGGMVSSGTPGAGVIAYLPDGSSPDNALGRRTEGTEIFYGTGANAVARMDGTRFDAGRIGTSALLAGVGSNVWRSLNGINYLIGS